MRLIVFGDQSRISEPVLRELACIPELAGGLEIVSDPPLYDVGMYMPALALIITDAPGQSSEQRILSWCREAEIQILCVSGRGSVICVGPLETPGRPGCTTCAQIRWENSIRQTNRKAVLARQFGRSSDIHLPLAFSTTQLAALGSIVAKELVTILAGREPHSIGHVGVYKRSGQLEWISLIPSHECDRCNLRPEDGYENADIRFESHFVQDMMSLRVNPVDTLPLSAYVNEDVGVVSALHTAASQKSGFVLATAMAQSPESDRQIGFGSGFSDESARKAAVLEVLERSCVSQSTAKRPVVRGSFHTLRDSALDPSILGMHRPFDDDKECSWVWAYSTRKAKPILILEQVAYYGSTTDNERFIYESSNGCAMGQTLEEAVLHGIFEVLERDGLMNMWYAQMPVPEFDILSDCPDSIQHYIDVLSQDGYQLRLFNISHDLPIPAVFAVAVCTENKVPKVVTGSATHLNPVQAVSSALRELMVQMLHLTGLSQERIEQGRAMVGDASKINHLLDHVVAAGMPEAYPRWYFLLEADRDQTPLTLTEAYPDIHSRFRLGSRDIHVILESVLTELHQQGFDVVIVNQTNAEAAYGGLHAVKVIIPGMFPVTFGFGNERFLGLKRLFELPQRMGYRTRILARADLNPDCHPLS